MGTNYYLETQEPCPHCSRGYDRLHIGKSSVGWCFSLHIIPKLGINTLDDWKKQWEGKKIFDEYENEISHQEMLSIITDRKKDFPLTKVPFGYNSWNTFYRNNHAEPGPNGLVRHQIDNIHCIGHGEGTWDYIKGEFS